MLITLAALPALLAYQLGLAGTAVIPRHTLKWMIITLQITTETKADGNYSSQMIVVNVEPGGLAGGDDTKIRLLLVRQGGGSAATIDRLHCCKPDVRCRHGAALLCQEICVLVHILPRVSNAASCRTSGSTGGS